MFAIGEVVLGDDMIWWGYAGFSGAIVASMALIASVMGLSMEIVLSLVARAGVVLLVLGLIVHLCSIALRRAPKPVTSVRAPVAVSRATAAVQPIPVKRVDPPRVAVPSAQPAVQGSAAVLWPSAAAR
jgi:hypothetical protein